MLVTFLLQKPKLLMKYFILIFSYYCIAYLPQMNFKPIYSMKYASLHNEAMYISLNKGNNKITELRTILQRESQNS